jgi:hypothetical protein
MSFSKPAVALEEVEIRQLSIDPGKDSRSPFATCGLEERRRPGLPPFGGPDQFAGSRPLTIGASAVVRWVSRRGAAAGSWLERMLTRKPRTLVMVALANKIARIVWAKTVRGAAYRDPVAAT